MRIVDSNKDLSFFALNLFILEGSRSQGIIGQMG
jgi:hypothetical protein